MKIFASRILTLTLALFGLAAAGAGVASAQDVYKVNYFSNSWAAGAPDATVRIDNPGLTYGNLCAMVYVFAADQQLAECCGCLQSHNNLSTFSVNYSLTSNTLTGELMPSGVLKVVSALPANGYTCDPSSAYKPTANLRVWATHIQNKVGTAWPITETESSDSALGATELANLQAQCSFIKVLGSGFGICSCGGATE